MPSSFGTEELVQEIADEFAAVEARAADYCATHARQSMMIFFHTPGAYQQTSQGYLGSMLAMLPFDNLSDTLVDPASRTVPIDTETAVSMNPDVIFAISPTAPTAEVLQGVYEEAFAENADLWNQLDAVKNGNIIYLSNEYVTSKGVQIVEQPEQAHRPAGGALPCGSLLRGRCERVSPSPILPTCRRRVTPIPSPWRPVPRRWCACPPPRCWPCMKWA